MSRIKKRLSFTQEKADEIRKAYWAQRKAAPLGAVKLIANLYGMPQSTISNIVCNRTWV